MCLGTNKGPPCFPVTTSRQQHTQAPGKWAVLGVSESGRVRGVWMFLRGQFRGLTWAVPGGRATRGWESGERESGESDNDSEGLLEGQELVSERGVDLRFWRRCSF